MGEPLKTFFSSEMVGRLAASIAAVESSFPTRAFQRKASRGLDDLELLDRGRHLAKALADCLPPTYPEALAILLRSLGPEHTSSELLGLGMAPFFYLPHVFFVAEYGLDHFELSMEAQKELTKRFTAEASIRPYLARYPERTLGVLRSWREDPNPHVRRLVSEGTRLRLPWAMRVPWLDQHPEAVLEVVSGLKDDPTTLVRRSVANHLNDLGKVHPTLLVETCERWYDPEVPHRRALVEHALRSAVKRGDGRALRLLGYGKKAALVLEAASFEPKRVRIGEKVRVTLALRSTSKSNQDVLVDLAVHFVKANGLASPKVFKLKRLSLEAGERVEVTTTVSLAVHTTRKPYPGRHAVDVLVNGAAFAAGAFDVVAGRTKG